MFACFLEENFIIHNDFDILNIGIGAGYWDRYLSYKVGNGSLTSVDIDRECADNLAACLENENNTINHFPLPEFCHKFLFPAPRKYVTQKKDDDPFHRPYFFT